MKIGSEIHPTNQEGASMKTAVARLTQTVDQSITFPNPWDHRRSYGVEEGAPLNTIARLRLWMDPTSVTAPRIVVLTEISQNLGVSITNGVEHFAVKLHREGFLRGPVDWLLEHYPGTAISDRTVSSVEIPWRRVERDDVSDLWTIFPGPPHWRPIHPAWLQSRGIDLE